MCKHGCNTSKESRSKYGVESGKEGEKRKKEKTEG